MRPVQNNHRTNGLACARLFFLFSIFALVTRLSWAQAPSGQFTFDFDATNTPLIDLSGNFDTSQDIVGAGGTTTALVFSLNITNDPSGRIRGAGVALVQVGSDFVVARYLATGNVSGGGLRPTHVSLTVRLAGEGPIAGQETTFTIALRYSLTLNVEDGLLRGTVRGAAHLGTLGSGVIHEDFATVPLPNGIDGSWSATLTVIPLAKLGGTGYISLPSGRTLQGIISGTYSTATGISKIRLTGVGGDKGFSVTFTTTSGEAGLQLETVRGRIFGQTMLE